MLSTKYSVENEIFNLNDGVLAREHENKIVYFLQTIISN